MAEETQAAQASGGAAPSMEEYAVSEACIACDACCNDFPEIFKMNADHTRAIAFAQAAKGTFNPWDIIYDCPVDAISLIKGELPPPPADKKPASGKKKEEELPPADVTDTRPWEVRWAEAQARGVGEPYWETLKRYGNALVIEESPTQYHLRVAMPSRVPEHPFKYRWNLPDKMPDYKFDIQLNSGGRMLFLKAWLEDQRVRRLCGIANSFPDRFLREVDLPRACQSIKQNYNPQEKVLDIILDKV